MRPVAPWVLLACGDGPLVRVRPSVRLIFGAALIAGCIIAPRDLGSGAAFTVALAFLAVSAAGAPSLVIGRALRFGLLLYLPLLFLLMVPVVLGYGEGRAGLAPALVTATTIVLKGCATLLIALSVISTLRHSELHGAIAGLPLPRLVRLLLLQIVQQAAGLYAETGRIRQALIVRAPTDRWFVSGRVLMALPRVWLERLAVRAERTALALELRGYTHHGAAPLPPGGDWARTDTMAILAVVIVLVAGTALRLWV